MPPSDAATSSLAASTASEAGSETRTELARQDLWRHRWARPLGTAGHVVLVTACAAGAVAVARFFDFWFRGEHVENPILYALLSLALWYGISRIVLGWLALLAMRAPTHVQPESGHSVAIFTTSSPGEPLAMFERTLAACQRITYPHVTYLLDDTQDPAFRELAERHGAKHLELVGLPGAKAGKINAALERTQEDFVLVLDPDHVPFPNFLDRVLGHFRDQRVGFVQVCQAYYNQARSGVARGAAEQTYAFYGPTQMGLDGLGSVLAIGANCTFRRTALASIAGHGVGLAEDLVTAIRLHAAGWRGVYVPEVVSRGLVPEDLPGFVQQQLKWARGVYEVLFVEFPLAFKRLTNWQRLCFATVGTYYFVGVTTLLYWLIPHLAIWLGSYPTRMSFSAFLVAGVPVAVFGSLVHFMAQATYCQPSLEAGLNLRGLALKIACWPVYTWGFWLALGDRFVRYVPTAKRSSSARLSSVAWPHLLSLAAFVASAVRVSVKVYRYEPDAAQALAMLGFAALFALMTLPALWWSLRRTAPARKDAWDEVPTWLG
ncbi:MAG: glycosyltransferase family 2 protein [Myxococcota bacterium]